MWWFVSAAKRNIHYPLIFFFFRILHNLHKINILSNTYILKKTHNRKICYNTNGSLFISANIRSQSPPYFWRLSLHPSFTQYLFSIPSTVKLVLKSIHSWNQDNYFNKISISIFQKKCLMNFEFILYLLNLVNKTLVNEFFKGQERDHSVRIQ